MICGKLEETNALLVKRDTWIKKGKKMSKVDLCFSSNKLLHCIDAWVTRPERPKGVKDVIKQARRAAA